MMMRMITTIIIIIITTIITIITGKHDIKEIYKTAILGNAHTSESTDVEFFYGATSPLCINYNVEISMNNSHNHN
jgi:hypothetical protein